MRRQPIFAYPRLSIGRFACLLLLASGPLPAGCDRSPDEQGLQSLFDEGEYLCREMRWEEARTVLREYLLYDPDHAGAHFYLGRAYLFSEDFRPAIAEGELQTALELFVEGGRISPIERFGHDYFELICYVESAKVYLLQIEFLLLIRVSAAYIQPLLDQAERYIAEAEQIMPNTKEVRSVKEAIAGYRRLSPPAFQHERVPQDPPMNI